MAVVPVITETVSEGVIFRWVGMLGNAVLADCDVGEEIDLSSFTERALQLNGPWTFGAGSPVRFVMEFNADPVNMPWFGITPPSGAVLMTPGRPYSTQVFALWPFTRFTRPRIASVYQPASGPVDVLLFCKTGVL